MTQTNKILDDIYDFIQQHFDTHRIIPTQREIATGCGISVTKVNDGLSQLEAQGRIIRIAFKSRGIRLITDDPQQEVIANDIAEEVYAHLVDMIQHGIVPSQDEIADACFLSRGAVRQALIWLEAQGRITRGSRQRDIQIQTE